MFLPGLHCQLNSYCHNFSDQLAFLSQARLSRDICVWSMICDNCKWMLGTLQTAAPLRQCIHDTQQLLIRSGVSGLNINRPYLPCQVATWSGMDGILINQIDHVVVRRSDAKYVSNCQSVRGIQSSSDHKLVRVECKYLRYRFPTCKHHDRLADWMMLS